MNPYMQANVIFSKFARDYMELKKDLPIRPSEMGVLNLITHSEDDWTPLMLADRMDVSKPMITAHIQALVKKGYIVRETSGADQRSFFVRPTETGKALADAFETRQTAILQGVEAQLGTAEFETLIRLMHEAQTILEQSKKRCEHERT